MKEKRSDYRAMCFVQYDRDTPLIFGIRQVFYDENNKPVRFEKIQGLQEMIDDINEIRRPITYDRFKDKIRYILQACYQPILDEYDFPGVNKTYGKFRPRKAP